MTESAVMHVWASSVVGVAMLAALTVAQLKDATCDKPENSPTEAVGVGGRDLETLTELANQHRYHELVDKSRAMLQAIVESDEKENLIAILDHLATGQRGLRQHSDAFASHKRSLEAKGRNGATAGDYLISYVEMITDLYHAGQHSDAIDMVSEARSMLGSVLSDEAEGLLDKLEGFVSYCKSDFESAIRLMNSGRQKMEVEETHDIIRHLKYMSCRLIQLRDTGYSPASKEYIGVQQSHQQLLKEIMSNGPWTDPNQLPVRYDPRLLAIPWHSIRRWPQLQSLARLLERYHERLALEYDSLRSDNKLLLDQDCIQAGNNGQWERFEITGASNNIETSTGCSKDTPSSCQFLEEARHVTPVAILRLGFSVIQSGTWIKPHHGMTNEMLKFHLGVKVPTGGCATMRVANETKSWEEGKVMLFDDSFEHEVHNRCDEERVVFQLAIKHPQLRSDPMYKALVIDAH